MPPESFVCLTSRKKRKCEIIDAALSPLGSMRWINTPSVSLRNWPETTQRTDQALVCSKKIPKKNPVAQEAKRILLASRYNWARSFFTKQPNTVAVCWNGLKGSRRAFMDGALDAGARRLFFEWAPLPGRVTIDPCGVNFANSLPRDIVTYLNWFTASGLRPNNWRSAGHGIEQRPPLEPLSSECIGSHKITEPFLFAPLQTPGDTQLCLFGGNFCTVEEFVDALCLASTHLPVGWHLRIKEHPTAPHAVAKYLGGEENLRVVLDNATDTFELVAASRGVVTVNSSVGLEALFFDKPVIAAGQCFWAINGVAQNAKTPEDLIKFFSAPSSMVFDRAARDAFMNYLTHKYYPAIPCGPSDASSTSDLSNMITERIRGSDTMGFWTCDERRSSDVPPSRP